MQCGCLGLRFCTKTEATLRATSLALSGTSSRHRYGPWHSLRAPAGLAAPVPVVDPVALVARVAGVALVARDVEDTPATTVAVALAVHVRLQDLAGAFRTGMPQQGTAKSAIGVTALEWGVVAPGRGIVENAWVHGSGPRLAFMVSMGTRGW